MLMLFLAGLTDEELDQMYWDELHRIIDSGDTTSDLLSAICKEQMRRW